jgi:hypothetical protein
MTLSRAERDAYPLCNSLKKNGERCRNFAGRGTPHLGYGACSYHLGNSPNHIASAERAAVAKRMLHFGGELDLEPADALLWTLRLSAGHVAFVKDELAAMTDDERLSFKGQVLSRIYAEERDRTARIAKAALDAGVAERMVRLAENYGEAIALLISGILSDLRLTTAQQELAREAVPRRLLELEAGPSAEAA